MTDTPKTVEPAYSAAFEAIKPELIAFLKENLSVEVYSELYQSPTVSVTILSTLR